MNIENISTAAPVERMPIETQTPAPVPPEVNAAQKVSTQVVKSQESESPFNGQTNNNPAEQTKLLAAELTEIMNDLQTNLGFSIREDMHHTVIVEIKNQKTNELIKQIPSEELLTIKEKMLELTGLIFDRSV